MALVTMLAAPDAVRALLITILNGQLLTLLGSRCSAASERPLAQPTRAQTAARPYPVWRQIRPLLIDRRQQRPAAAA
jgi:hypothetical protein